jgi:hypothetical protein
MHAGSVPRSIYYNRTSQPRTSPELTFSKPNIALHDVVQWMSDD